MNETPLEPDRPAESDAGGPQPGDEADRIVYASRDLLHGRREIWIDHAGQLYRLRVTNNGKLILTK